MKILDSTASNRSMWYQKNNKFTIFIDKRCESTRIREEGQTINVFPDVRCVWQNLPFKNEIFDMVIFDPPHLIKKHDGKKLPKLTIKYGVFFEDNWREEIRNGILELFRSLKQNGIFILKWNEIDKPIEEIINMFPVRPMFGTRTGQKNNTHWICFLKYNANSQLSDF